jgi:hypothetical protein
MSDPVLLNNIDHGGLSVVLDRDAAYGDAINQAVVFATEFEELQREYAILFRRDPAGVYRATVLLGFDADENLFLDGKNWDARYVPAIMTRGPFTIGLPPEGETGEPMIHIDPSHPRVRSNGEGAPIFLDQGGNAPLLDHVSTALQRIFVGRQVAAAMFAAFEAYDLIQPVTLRVETPDGRRFTVPDGYAIAQDRLGALDGAALAALHRADFLRPAIWAASSLGNVPALVERKRRRDG